MKDTLHISPLVGEMSSIESSNRDNLPMGRPHIEFIQTTDLELQPWQISGVISKAQARTLSRDSNCGAATELVSFPTGWSAPVGYFSTDIEIFILDGHLKIGCYRLKQYSYAYIPAGICSGLWEVQKDTTALWMSSATPCFIATSEHRHGARHDNYIPSLDTSALPWSGAITPGFPPGAMRKTLRTDPDTGSSTWLLGVLPQWCDRRVEIHPVVEEAYVVMGEMSTPLGKMTPGCYFWRPAHIPHGPFSTSIGVLIFFRTDGHLRTNYILPDE
ncbi:MAG: DUF4437 domain-containing protein [Nostochopsis sp.]